MDLDDTPPQNGRFENGTLIIGTAPTTVTITPVTGNGNNRVVFPTASIAGLPFFAKDNDSSGNSTMSGTISEVEKIDAYFIWTLNVTASSETPIDWPDFQGGKLSVGGGAEVTINTAAGGTQMVATSAMNIPCVLRDDDDNTLLPKLPDTSLMIAAYKPAYVVPFYDVGDYNMNVPFAPNITAAEATATGVMDWDSQTVNAPDFWVAYLLTAFQHATIKDADATSEIQTLGATQGGAGGSLVYREVHQIHEGISDPVREEQITVVHETGHAVGNSGVHPVTGNNDQDSTFTSFYLNRIRSSSKPGS
jgi:hypothetical protein